MGNNEELSIKGTVSLEDFLKYNAYYNNRVLKRYFIYSFFILWAIAILQKMPLPSNLLLMMFVLIPQGIFALILSFLIFLTLNKALKRRAIKEYESDQIIKNEASYTANSEGINQHIRRSNNFFEWRDIRLALEREEMFLLYVSKRKAIVLPKTFFGSNDEINLFKNIVSKNIETSKIKFN